MMFKNSIGIEIAGKDLRLAVLRSRLGKLRLVQTLDVPGFVGLAQGDQVSAIVQLVTRHKLSASSVYLTLSRDQGIVRQFEFPVEVLEKLRSSVALQLETLCPWPAEEIYWDFSGDSPRKGSKSIRVTVAIIPRLVLDPWIELFRLAKLPLSGASLSSLSIAHGVGSLWKGNAPTIVLDCESGYVEGVVVQSGQLFSVTQNGDEVSHSAQSVIQRLLALSRLPSLETVRLIVCGSEGQSIELAARVALPIENAKADSSDKFGAIASSLNSLRKSGFETNLIPSALRYRRSQAPLIPAYVLLVLTAILGLLLAMREPYQLTGYASTIDSEIQRIAPVAREVSKQQSELNKLSERYRALSAGFKSRDYNLEALRELTRTLPPTAWLTNYSYQDGSVTISGLADSASELQKLLEDTALFKEVQFTSSVTRDAKGKDHFTIKANIEVPR